MPAYQARLSQEERWAVLDYIRTFTYTPGSEIVAIPSSQGTENLASEREECGPYLELVNPFAGNDVEAISGGQAVYQSNCTTCHGEDGTGRLPGILDFTDPLSQGELDAEPLNYYCAVAEGFQSMPAFKDELNESAIWQVLTYIASFDE